MSNSTYKGYTLQDTGTNNGTWGSTLNTNALSYIDQNMGGITNVTLSGSDVVLSESQSRSAIIRLSGILLANVTVTVSNLTATGPNAYGGGFFFVENLTSGNFTVSVRNTNIATAATVPQGTRATLISDASNGVRVASEYNPTAFAAGTKIVFAQQNAPLGWTKATDNDNKALRIVGNSWIGTGGSTAFTSVFSARTISTANLPDHNVGVSISDPGHYHTYYSVFYVSPNQRSICASGSSYPSGAETTDSVQTGITASGSFGNAQRGGGQSTIDFNVAYVDAIICTKN